MKELHFGHITTKILAYSGVFDFFRYKCWQKNFPPQPKFTFWKYNWKLNFRTLFLEQNAPKKNSEQQLYSTLSENCYLIWFWTSGSAQTRKHIKYANTPPMAIKLLWHSPGHCTLSLYLVPIKIFNILGFLLLLKKNINSLPSVPAVLDLKSFT